MISFCKFFGPNKIGTSGLVVAVRWFKPFWARVDKVAKDIRDEASDMLWSGDPEKMPAGAALVQSPSTVRALAIIMVTLNIVLKVLPRPRRRYRIVYPLRGGHAPADVVASLDWFGVHVAIVRMVPPSNLTAVVPPSYLTADQVIEFGKGIGIRWDTPDGVTPQCAYCGEKTNMRAYTRVSTGLSWPACCTKEKCLYQWEPLPAKYETRGP